MAAPTLYPRFLRNRLEEALENTPVVFVHGPRQCGKTTLARMVGDAAGYEYITFDDDVQLAAAASDPVGFVADLLGKTGSVNVLLVPKLADSLDGRMEIQRLHPLSQDELTGKARRRRGESRCYGDGKGFPWIEKTP